MKNDGYGALSIPSRYAMRPEGEMMQSSLSSELKKYYEKADMSAQVQFVKRTKLYPVMPEVKHLMMALQS